MRKIVLLLSLIFLAAIVYAASFSNITQSDFNNGTYANTSYNGVGVILSGTNLTGTYTSRVFDASGIARWDNITSTTLMPTVDYLFAVDNSAGVWKSTDAGVTWTQSSSDYNGALGNVGAINIVNNASGSLFVANGQKLFGSDDGIAWRLVNDDTNNGGDSNDAVAMAIDGNTIYIIDGSEDVLKSTNSGASFTKVNNTDFNGGNGGVQAMIVNSSGAIFAVDTQADVWLSVNSGVSWTLIYDDYNGGGLGNGAGDMAVNGSDAIFILYGQDLWQSTNSGASWTMINDDFNGGPDSGNGQAVEIDANSYIYIADGSEDIYKSTDSGVSFTRTIENLNGADGLIKGLTSLSKRTNLTFQVKNCSQADCSDGTWQNVNLSNINLTGRYFQYKATLASQDTSITPKLYNVSIEYTILDNTAPSIEIISPLNSSYATNQILVNLSASDASGISSIWFYNGSQNLSYNLPAEYTFSQGDNIFIAYANDTFNNLNYTTVSFYVDSVAPTLSIVLPEAKTYGYNSSLPLNYSVSDAPGVSSCWYNLDSGSNISLPNCMNTTFNASDFASHEIYLYANDTLGNLASLTRTFSINTQIQINLVSPNDNEWLKESSAELNYTVATEAVVYNCSLLINGIFNQTNLSINTTGGINKFSINLGDGAYIWNVFCTDSYNSLGSNRTINIDATKPQLSLSYPVNNSVFAQNVSIPLNFSVSDANLQKCGYSLGGENYTVSGCSNLIFGYANGTYNLTIYANDSAGNLASYEIYNLTIYYDSAAPGLVITEPSGTKASVTGIPLQFSVSDSDILQECWYNFTSIDGTIIKTNTAVTNCQNTSFDVSVATGYLFYLSARDRTGNINVTNSSFTVSIPANPPSSPGGGGSGGGGGSYSNATKISKLEVSGIQNMIVNPGESKRITVTARNTGTKFLNGCRIQGIRENSGWVSSEGIRNIGNGEIAEFSVGLKIPESLQPGRYNISLVAKCQETSQETGFSVEIIERRLGIDLLDVKREGSGKIKVVYALAELSDQEQTVQVAIIGMDGSGKKLFESDEIRVIGAGEKQTYETIIETGFSGSGISVLINANSDVSSVFVQKEIILGNPPLTGLVSLLSSGGGSLIAVVIIVFGIFSFFVARRIIKFRKMAGLKKVRDKKYIELRPHQI